MMRVLIHTYGLTGESEFDMCLTRRMALAYPLFAFGRSAKARSPCEPCVAVFGWL